MKNTLMLLGIALLPAVACHRVQSRVHDGKVDTVINQAPDRSAFIEAIGIAPATPCPRTRSARPYATAIVSVQKMLSMLRGVTLEGGITVERALETDSKLEARLKEVIRGAEVIKSEFTDDQGCVVTLRLPRARVEALGAPSK